MLAASLLLDLQRWVGTGGWLSDKVTLAPSAACGGGTGVFATRDLEPAEPLASIPVGMCVTAADACSDSQLGPAVTDYLRPRVRLPGAESIAVAALLVHARFGESPAALQARTRWAPYLHALPWTPDAPEVLDAPADDTTGEVAKKMAELRADNLQRCKAVHEVLGGRHSLENCAQAMRLVDSRAFTLTPFLSPTQLSRLAPTKGNHVMVPWADCFNHPSRAAVVAGGDDSAFATWYGSPEDAVIRWQLERQHDVRSRWVVRRWRMGLRSAMPQNCLARRPHQPLLPPPPRLSPKTYIRTHTPALASTPAPRMRQSGPLACSPPPSSLSKRATSSSTGMAALVPARRRPRLVRLVRPSFWSSTDFHPGSSGDTR